MACDAMVMVDMTLNDDLNTKVKVIHFGTNQFLTIYDFL